MKKTIKQTFKKSVRIILEKRWIREADSLLMILGQLHGFSQHEIDSIKNTLIHTAHLNYARGLFGKSFEDHINKL